MFRPALFLFAALLSAAPLTAAANPTIAALMSAADRENWSEARRLASTAGDPAAMDLYDWRLLSAGDGRWEEYRSFVSRNPDWPNLARIRKKGEAVMPPGLPLSVIDEFTGPGGALTGTGALRRADALTAAGRSEEAAAEAVRAWRTLSLDINEENALLQRYGAALSPHHAARADELLWRGLTGEALRMKRLVPPGWPQLIEARARLRTRGDGVDALVAAIPGPLANHPGLAYERFIWRMRADLYEGATQLIRAQSGSAAMLGRPALWGPRRALLARRLHRAGDYRTAYEVASRNYIGSGSDYSDLEFLSGWLSLRYLNDANRAAGHFRNLIAAVETPISLGRGYYWLGRALEAAGDQGGANQAYREAAVHQTSFYGQLASEKAGIAPSPLLAASPDGDWRNTSFAGKSITRAAQLLASAGDRRRTHWFMTHLATTLTGYQDLAGAAELAIFQMNRPDIAVRIAKIAARKGHVLNGAYYPNTELAKLNAGVEPALAMAIARQESELNPDAVSHAGARGLMQLMPATAQKVAGWIGQPYSRARLTSDWRYNATLGQTYLARRLAQYDGAVALAAAAYNAGAGRVDNWLVQYGDPRTGRVDWIDWIETIPFNETRNYVQRVIEGLQVYRSRISGTPTPFRVKEDALGR